MLAGKALGRVYEFAVDPAHDEAHVAALVLKRRANGKTHTTLLPVTEISMPKAGQTGLSAKITPKPIRKLNDYLLLERDLLDQQIIDVERVIPWDFVDLIERDPARRVRLKIGQERLSKLHPSDIADILEDLAPGEREAVFSSLPEETAAETLEEVDPKMQKALLQGLDSERAADILEEMDPGAAADVLAELSDEESEAILEEMEPEERHEVEELLEFSADSAAGG
jgi:hypothetical protein